MKYSRRIVISVVWCVLGAVLIGLSFAGIIDRFWNGMGSGFLVVGILQVVRQLKYRSNEEYREKVDIAVDDERNKYIANKAWAWAGYLYVMLAAGVVVIAKILGYDEASAMAAWSVCLLMVIYWICHMVLRKKY